MLCRRIRTMSGPSTPSSTSIACRVLVKMLLLTHCCGKKTNVSVEANKATTGKVVYVCVTAFGAASPWAYTHRRKRSCYPLSPTDRSLPNCPSVDRKVPTSGRTRLLALCSLTVPMFIKQTADSPVAS